MIQNGNTRKFWGLPSFFILLTVNLVILVFSTNTMLLTPKVWGMNALAFFQKGLYETASWFGRTVNSINELKDLKAQYNLTLKQLNEYQKMDQNFREILRENKLLKEQLGFSKSFEIEHIPAAVIARDPVEMFSSFIINKGHRDGVSKGMPVTACQKGRVGLVGKVIQTGSFTSRVIPIYNSTLHVAARFQDSRYEGLISGMGRKENHLVMNYVKKTALERIHLDDIIITSGMQSLYPKGISIGRVNNITSREYNTSLEISVIPSIDFGSLEHVFILKNLKQGQKEGDYEN